MWHLLSTFFFFNDTATTEIYTLSLHDALPIWGLLQLQADVDGDRDHQQREQERDAPAPRGERFGLAHPVPALAADGRDRHLRSEEHTSELQSQSNLVCRPLLEKKKRSRQTDEP